MNQESFNSLDLINIKFSYNKNYILNDLNLRMKVTL